MVRRHIRVTRKRVNLAGVSFKGLVGWLHVSADCKRYDELLSATQPATGRVESRIKI